MGDYFGEYGARRTAGKRKRRFIGWRSEELAGFLNSVGKDSDEPLPQPLVCDIILKYIQDHKLNHPTKRKKVVCDDLLHALFRRKEVNRLGIWKLLDRHFADNQLFDEEEEEAGFWFSEDFVYKQKSLGTKEKVSYVPTNAFASISVDNIKLVYLRRSLVVKFMKYPDTFEERMVGSFVRVKSEINASNASKSLFQLVLVTGVDAVSQAGGSGETATGFFLRVADIANDIRITMISDDDFSEEECDDLRQRVNQGLVRRVTVMELDSKARSLHEDITNHWIDQEVVMLQNKIDLANEKGWRRDTLFEYVERKELLETAEERSRLLANPIIVAADPEMELEANQSHEDYAGKNQENEVGPREFDEDREDEDNGFLTLQTPKKRCRKKGSNKNIFVAAEDTFMTYPQKELGTTFNVLADATPDQREMFEAERENHPEEQAEGKCAGEWVAKGRNIVVEIDKSDKEKVEKAETQNCAVEVINIDDDDDNGDDSQKEDKSKDVDEKQFMWHYEDPNGDIQGPFPKYFLRSWKENGYFDKNFRVWRSGQDPREAILLNDLLR